jgi:hypothetical protein
MRRTKIGVSPTVEIMEPRELLSMGAPLVSRHVLSGVVRDVRAIMSTLARTQDVGQASAQLDNLSSRIPSGPAGLAPSWQTDIGLYRPDSARSITTTQSRILGDLRRFVQGGNRAASGSVSPTPTTTGPGAGVTAAPGHGTWGTPAPVPASSLDSVKIQNTTGLALLVTVHLKVPQIQQPWITETIPVEGNTIASFNFGTATNAFMTMDVSLANGGQSPPPLTDLSLSQPMTGYNGALFSISLLGPYFNVTPL